jgi:hypothetical protein
MSKAREDSLSPDLLHGAKAIGEFLGLSERQVWHHAENHNLPVKKMGRLLIGSKTVLRRHFAEAGEASVQPVL